MANEPVSPITNKEESATTREEMDFDDTEHEQETGRVSPLGHETANKPTAKSPSPKPRVSFQEHSEEIPPQKPPRPLSPRVQAENTLIEAFPSIDAKVVKAVLAASGGKVEPAFNALLGMTDPDFKPEEAAPPQPPRPQQRQQPQSQLEADELYARQLAEHYNNQMPRQQNQYNQREPGRRGPNQQRPRYDEDDNERSFFDDELPEIGRNIQRGFMETQKQVNSWINNFKKKIDGEDEEEDLYSGSGPAGQGRQNFGPSQSEQLHGIRKSAERQRRSVEQQRYDADPHVLDDEEFHRLELRDDDEARKFRSSPKHARHCANAAVAPPQPPRTSSRKAANPDLFKSQPKPPQSGPVDEVDAADRSADPSSDKNKKWQSLTSVAPNPEEDNDPFSLGDDDEDEKKEKTEDLRKEDSERLKEKARASVGSAEGAEGGVGKGKGEGLQESERSGSINAEAAELLKGSKK